MNRHLTDPCGGCLGPSSRSIDVARDGRFLMARRVPTDTTGAVVVVDNFFAELRRLVPN